MKTPERDNLLIRLDERSRNTWAMIERIESHLDKLNNSVAENTHFRKLVKPWFVATIIGVTAIVLRSVGVY
ncbi:hypothetical protein LCGC14_2387200 [marine sediment metagenome]|uniref:Uncharacterized protein n=1 Tax=marine sediment metagenome TaxID=412755 RepID=A0A0F9EBM5_9ZZZZ